MHAFSATAAQLISLQYGDCRSEIESACAGTGIPVAHWPDALSDLDETAALMCALDLVVTVDNTVAHLAGALGRPAWVLLSFSPEWRYLAHGHDMPWYPSLRLFRQSRPGDWRAPLASIRAEMQQVRGAAA
jgi:ADP-heptose:LPS heptosyltransferase